MSKLSIIIPSRNERFLVPTVKGIFENARGPIECVVILDGGEWPNPEPLPERDDLIIIRHPESKGTRASINAGVAIASGEFILKSDGHCLFAPGFDLAMKAVCGENVVAVPRRKRLDAENWRVEETGRSNCDYEYIQWHPTDFGGRGHNITRWEERNSDWPLTNTRIDDLMVFQASCWAMRRDYFFALDLMDESTYGKTQNEGEEIAFKCWLSGGRVIVNKDTWYAHLWKGKRYPRDYKFEESDLEQASVGVGKWLTDSAWPGGKQTLPFASLVERFWPLPGWPENWKEVVLAGEFNDALTGLFRDQLLSTSAPSVRQQLLSNPALIIDKAEYGSDDKHKVDVTETLRDAVADGIADLIDTMAAQEFDILFGNPARGRRKHLSVWCTLNDQPYLFVMEGKGERSNRVSDAQRHPDAADFALHELDQPSARPRELPADGLAAPHGLVLSNDLRQAPRDTLDRILHKFNLDRQADYSKVSMPIGLRINRRQLAELFAELRFKIGAEIGTAAGEFAEVLCKANPALKLFCVDPWMPYSGYKDYTGQQTLNALYESAKTRLAPYNVKFLRKFSLEAAHDVEDGSLDFVYIDGNHRFEYVVADIAAWLPKIRSAGIIAGHDYSNPKGKGFGVIQAVRGWTEANGVAPWFVLKGAYEATGDRSHSWLWVKP